jgi:hypothetical protein
MLCFSRFCKPSPLQAHWGGGAATPTFSCLLPASLLTVPVKTAPPPLSRVQSAPPSLLNVFFFPATYYSDCFFPLFPLGGSQSVQGAMLIYHVLLSSPGGLHLPKQSESWCLEAQEPSWFLRLSWSGDAMCGLGVWRSRSFASSWWFFL